MDFLQLLLKLKTDWHIYEALDKTHMTENYSDFIALVEREVEDSLYLYLSTIS